MSRYDRYSEEAIDVLLAVQDLARAASRDETGLDDLSRALAVAAVPELLEIAGNNGAFLDRARLKKAFDEFLSITPSPLANSAPASDAAAGERAPSGPPAGEPAVPDRGRETGGWNAGTDELELFPRDEFLGASLEDSAPAASMAPGQPDLAAEPVAEPVPEAAAGLAAEPVPEAAPAVRLRVSAELRAVLDVAERLAGEGAVEPAHIVRAAWPSVRGRLEPFFERDGSDREPLELPGAPDEYLQEDPLEVLLRYGRELGDSGDPVIGRDAEIETLASVLLRWGTPNALLVGPSGVGKTAIVRGLAARIARGEVAAPLRGIRIFEIRAGDLAAGTGIHGAFEERIAEIVAAVEASPEAVVFLDEMHQISGSYTNDPTADLLKPALSSRKFRLIGATTDADFRRHLEREDALLRRFQVIRVAEPDRAATARILAGLAPRLEAHFGVALPPERLDLARRLAERYMPDRAFPDKAVDLLDRACARALVRAPAGEAKGPAPADAPPEAPVATEASAEALGTTHPRIEAPAAKAPATEPPGLATPESDAPATTMPGGAMPSEPGDRLPPEDEAALGSEAPGAASLPPLPVRLLVETLEDLAGVRLDEDAADPSALEGLEERLARSVMGQDAAVSRLSEVVRVAKLRLGSRPGRPDGAFLFTGPTGVGKTELALALARELSGREDALLRIDMGEFSEGHSISRLLGSPPGYVGFGEGALLARATEGRTAVVLLDELEKAHPQVHRLFLRLLDTGKATDATGRELDFSNLVVVATCNVGDWSSEPIGFASARSGAAEVPTAALRRVFAPEFLGRFDAVIPFRPLGSEDCGRILAELIVPRASARLVEERGYSLELDGALAALVAARGYDPASGARGLERAFVELVATPLAAFLPRLGAAGRLRGALGPDGKASFEILEA